MTLSNYHKKYSEKSQERINMQMLAKRAELQNILAKHKLSIEGDIVRVAILGCADVRMVNAHRELFSDLLGKSIDLITFDISVEHLQGEDGVVEQDVTKPLDQGPFDISYAHVLLKFIEPVKQIDVIKNSYDALDAGGLAIHVFNGDELELGEGLLSDGMNRVSRSDISDYLESEGIKYDWMQFTVEGVLPESLEVTALVIIK